MPKMIISRLLFGLLVIVLFSNGAASSVGAKNSIVVSTRSKSGQIKAVGKQVNKKTKKVGVILPPDIPCRSWLPTKVPTTMVLLCVHGLGLNSKSYEGFGQRVAQLGVATYALDVRGFGRWMERAGKDQVDFDACLTDIEKVLKALRASYQKLPVYILGESMGGAIALRVAAVQPDLVDGLISAVPSGDRFHKTRNQLRVALRLITGRKNKPMDVGDKLVQDATDDPALQERWKDDPLNRMELTPKELMQFQGFMNENHDAAPKIDRKPVLVICGFKDRLVKPQGTVELFNELTTPDKMLVILGNGEHLIFEEGQLTDQACWVLMGWLNSHNPHKVASAHKGK
jgi:alpha-beta hydrolase superfamily lysophospholipase